MNKNSIIGKKRTKDNIEESFIMEDIKMKNQDMDLDDKNQNSLTDSEGDSDVLTNDDLTYQFKPLLQPKNQTRLPTKHMKLKLKLKCLYLSMAMVFCVIFVCVAFVLVTKRLCIQDCNDPHNDRDYNNTPTGCNNISKTVIWTLGIPKLMTESAFRLIDINEDGILDIVFGFATGAEGHFSPDYLCDIYFNGSHPCFGGVIALDGRTGNELWRHYTKHEIFALNCGQDLDKDDVFDCLAAGRVATFEAVSGRTGATIWSFKHGEKVQEMNFYTGQFIPDLDGDGIPDVLNTHGGDPFGEPGSNTRLSGKIFILSGATGKVLQWVTVPDGKECYYSPVLYQPREGVRAVLFGTGGETHGGSLWYILLRDLYNGDIDKARALFSDEHKGIMTPPVLLDMTGDGILDIMFNTFNSSSILMDGNTFEIIWNFTYPSSETYATPSVGFFNGDEIPDFMVHWQYGEGFPIYYHSVTTFLDGKNGRSLIQPFIRDTIGVQTSPLTISVEGFGNDIFLFYTDDCMGHEGQGGKYTFVAGTNVHEKSRSDICHLRFNTEAVSKLHAMSRHTKSPGVTIYDSIENKQLESSAWVNTTEEALAFLASHPKHKKEYEQWRQWAKQYQEQNKGATQSRNEFPDKDIENTEDQVKTILTDILKEYMGQQINHTYNGQKNYRSMNGKYFGKTKTRQKRNLHGHGKGKRREKSDTRRQSPEKVKRHVGPHDSGGLQRLISTGTLAPSLLDKFDPLYNRSMDIVFATYWFYPAKTEVILPEDQSCIDEKMAQEVIRFDPNSKYYGMDNDGYEHAITHECLEASKHTMPENRVYESQDTKDPYVIHMGQLTVYRIRITCSCDVAEGHSEKTRCSRILPYESQQWPEYMGKHADSHWLPRRHSTG